MPRLRVVASRIGFRDLLLDVMSASLEVRDALIKVGGEHTETLMPRYSYIQHIEPATLANT